MGAADARRARHRPRRDPGRRHAPRARLPRRARGRRSRRSSTRCSSGRARRARSLEEGCLSLPGVLVEVERPIHVRVRAQDERGEPILIEASGLEARVHPARDGPPRRRPDPRPHVARPAQAGDAHAPRGGAEPRSAWPERLTAMRTVYLGTSEFAAAVLERLAASAAPPGARGHAARRARRAAARSSRRRRWPTRRARSGSRSSSPRDLHAPDVAASDRRRAARGADRLRVRRADQGAAALATTRCSTSTRRCCRAGAGRRRSSGRSWPATRRPACRSCALTAGWDSGPVCAAREREPIRPDDDYGTLAAAAARRSARELLVRALDERPPSVEQDEAQRHLRAQDRGRATARWTRRSRPRRSSARCARCGRTSARGCRCPDGDVPRRGRARGSTARRSRPPAAACAPTASGCCSTATAARSS